MNTSSLEQFYAKEKEIEALSNKLLLEKGELVKLAKSEFIKALGESFNIWCRIPEYAQQQILKEKAIDDILLQWRTDPKGRKARAASEDAFKVKLSMSDENMAKILAAIPTKDTPEKDRPTNSEIAKAVKKNAAGFGKKLDYLRDQKKIDFTQDGTSKRWFKL
jgi:hypothetical protein